MSEIKSELKATLLHATKDAMRARDKERVATLRMVNSEVKRIEVDERREVSDDDVMTVLNKMLKQRQDALSQFKKAGRDDLAEVEAYEMTVIEGFLPAQMDPEELEAFVASLIEQSGAVGMQDMGKVMAVATKELNGKADGKLISSFVRERLQ